MKKTLAIFLALCLMLGAIPALAVSTDDVVPKLSDEKVSFSLTLLKGAVAGDPNEIWFWNYFEKHTNVHFDITEIDSTIWTEKKNVMFASNDYSDVFWGPTFTNAELVKFGQEGYFIPLNDLIDENMPNLLKLMEQYPNIRAQIAATDGNIYSLPTLQPGTKHSDDRAWINTNWLANVGLEMPTTLDEFYNMLVAFKEQDADGDGDVNNEIPWGGAFQSNNSGRTAVLAALGFIYKEGNNVALRNGEACYLPYHPDYKYYLEFAHKCWENGLLDEDIFTQTGTQFSARAIDRTYGYGGLGTSFSMGGHDEEGYTQYAHVIPMTSAINDTPVWFKSSIVKSVGAMEITDVCKDPALALRWADMFYDPNVAILFHNGPIINTESDPDGIGWDPATGGTEPKGLTAANPENLGWWDYLCEYMVPRGRGGVWYFSIDDYYALDEATVIDYNRVVHGEEGYWRTSNQENAGAYFTEGYPSVIFYSDEDNQTLLELLTPLDDYAAMMEAKFITGEESLDNYDAYIAELTKIGADKVDAIYKATYAASQAK